MSEELCGCIRCHAERFRGNPAMLPALGGFIEGFRYACEICGNKRCPHHTDHRLACTNSNAVGQIGSAYE